MAKTQYIDNIDAKFQEMLAAVLRNRAAGNDASSTHLDEDTLAAFSSGNLTQREMLPAVAHVADCGFCRTTTSELIRLDAALMETEPVSAKASVAESAGLADAISNWFSRLFGGSEAGVFAHGEPEDDEKEKEDEENAPSDEEK